MKGIYIAGPMTGHKDFNRDAFYDAEKYLTSMGYDINDIGNPARFDEVNYSADVLISETGAMEDSIAKGFDFRKTFNQDLSFLCEKAGAIYMLYGWERSGGARAEHAVASALRLEIIYQRNV